MKRIHYRYLIILGLGAVIVVGWSLSIKYYFSHLTAISTTDNGVMYSITLPFKIAHLSQQEPNQELPVPVYGVTVDEIADTWGEARSEGRTHEGVDIFAASGTPVFSSTRGYVIRVNIGDLGGENAMVIGPGGLMYYYAHFSRVADGIRPGMAVTPDTVLGFVGDTGNATTTPPHLHFGIYEERWDAINPYELLENR